MDISFESIPLLSDKRYRAAVHAAPVSRRSFGRRMRAAGVGAGAAYLAFAARALPAGAVADGEYFKEISNTANPSPCVGGYAEGHSEEGIKCGPSSQCARIHNGGLDYPCCFTNASVPPPPLGTKDAQADQSNGYGWHKVSVSSNGLNYQQRPDECWGGGSSSDYDSWRWVTNGVTYGCSDGYTHTSWPASQGFPSICPFQR